MNIGILGLGHIAEKMADTINHTEGFTLYAVASRSMEKAYAFLKKYNAKKAYGSYTELLEDPDVELIYIATPHSLHKEEMLECLLHDKPVLCEKSFTTCSKDTKEIYEAFEKRNLFVTEALWTSFQPSRGIINELLESNTIGRILRMDAYFEYDVKDKERIKRRDLGGGAAMDLGVYPLSFILRTLGKNYTEVKLLNREFLKDVDIKETLLLSYPGISAICHTDGTKTGRQDVVIEGECGSIHINSVNNPSEILIKDKDGCVLRRIGCAPSYNGYEYELIAAKAAIKEKKTECMEWSHADSVLLSEINDAIIY